MSEKKPALPPENLAALRKAAETPVPETQPEPSPAPEPVPVVKKSNPRRQRGSGKGGAKGSAPEAVDTLDAQLLLNSNPKALFLPGYAPVGAEDDKPVSRREFLDRLKEKVTAIREGVRSADAEIKAITTDNGEAARLREVESIREHGTDERLGRRSDSVNRLAQNANVNPERLQAQRVEDAYIDAYKAFHLKEQTQGRFTAGAEKKIMDDLEAKAREAQVTYINALRKSSETRLKGKAGKALNEMETFKERSVRTRVVYERLKAKGELNTPFLQKDGYEKWVKDYAAAYAVELKKRYMRQMAYTEVTKPFMVRKNRARAEALEARRFGFGDKTLIWMGRKAAEANKNFEGGIQKRLEGKTFKAGKMEITISPALAQRLAKAGARGTRLLATTVAVAGGGFVLGAVGALGLAGYRLSTGLLGIAGGTTAGWSFGAIFERTFGKSRRNKRALTASVAGNSRNLTPQDLRNAEKYEALGSEEAIAALRNRIELTTAALVAGGVTLGAAELAGNVEVVQEATERVRNARIDLQVSGEQIERLRRIQSEMDTPAPATETAPPAVDAPEPLPTPPTETISKVQSVSETAQAGDGSDVMFRRLKADLAKQYQGNTNVPPKVQEILKTDEHLLSRKYRLAWDSKTPGAVDESAQLKVGDKFGINADGKPTITRDGVTIVLEEGKELPKEFGGEVAVKPVVTEPEAVAPKAPIAAASAEPVRVAPVELVGGLKVEPQDSVAADTATLSTDAIPKPEVQQPSSLSDYIDETPAGDAVASAEGKIPNPNSISFSQYSSAQEFDPQPDVGLAKGVADPTITTTYKIKGSTWVLGGAFADQRSEALKLAREFPNTLVKFEGQPYMVDGRLQRWTATAISDGTSVVAPPYPTSEMDLKAPPKFDSFMQIIEKSAAAPQSSGGLTTLNEYTKR